MRTAPSLDVSRLPRFAYGPRATLWWGVVGLLVIEGTMFAMLVATYFYLQIAGDAWPPPGTPPARLLAAVLNVVLLIGSVAPMYVMHRASWRADRRAVGIWLAVGTLIGGGNLVLRGFEFAALNCRWDSHAYGSILWTILALHAGHLVSSTLENLLLALLMFIGPVERKHFVDASLNALYWYFVVASWLPLFLLVYVVPRL
jgi:heme/copper-type cytochrome/quinol oxidase subunit 3